MPLYFIFVDGQKLFVDCGAGLLLYDLITVPPGFNDQVIPKRDNLLPKCDKKARGRGRAGLASEFPLLKGGLFSAGACRKVSKPLNDRRAACPTQDGCCHASNTFQPVRSGRSAR